MNIISILLGIVAAIIMIPGIIPLLGWLLWLVVVLCVLGIVFGALSKQRSGVIINASVLVISLVRLTLGGGVF